MNLRAASPNQRFGEPLVQWVLKPGFRIKVRGVRVKAAGFPGTIADIKARHAPFVWFVIFLKHPFSVYNLLVPCCGGGLLRANAPRLRRFLV
jgi:hypothetical protein